MSLLHFRNLGDPLLLVWFSMNVAFQKEDLTHNSLKVGIQMMLFVHMFIQAVYRGEGEVSISIAVLHRTPARLGCVSQFVFFADMLYSVVFPGGAVNRHTARAFATAALKPPIWEVDHLMSPKVAFSSEAGTVRAAGEVAGKATSLCGKCWSFR